MDAPTPQPDLDELRTAMECAIEAREKAQIVEIFGRMKHMRSEAAASEVLHNQEKNTKSQRAAHETRVHVERLLGQWLITLEEQRLRYIRQSEGKKIGALMDPSVLIIDELRITKPESRAWQRIARLTETEFQTLLADLTAGPMIARFSVRKSNRSRRAFTGTELLAPRSVPSTLRELAKLHRDIAKTETYKALRRIECKAEALKKLFADIDVVRIEAGKVIVFANHRIGEELNKLPPAKASGSNQHKKKEPRSEKAAPPSLKESVGSRTRGTRLKKLGSQPKPVVEAAVEKLADMGRDITVNAVLKTISTEETTKKREQSRKMTPLDAAPVAQSEPAPPSDSYADERAELRGLICALAKFKDLDFDQVAAAMPIEQLREAGEELHDAKGVVFAWSEALATSAR
jgi:hypothetical protein